MRRTAVGMAMAVLAGVAAGQETGGNARDGVYVMDLNGALEGGKTLTLYLDRQTNAFGMCFGFGRRYNRMSYDVDASGLRVEPGSDAGAAAKVKGPVQVIVHSDGYVPRTDAPVSCAYELDCTAAGRSVQGLFQGTFGSTSVTGDVNGEIRARAAADPSHLNLNMENAIGHSKGRKGGGRRLIMQMGIRDGKAFGVRVDPPGSLTDVGCAPRVETADLKMAEGRLTGNVKVVVTPQSQGEAEVYVFTFDGMAIGDTTAGRFATTCGGQAVEEGRWLGSVRAGEPPKPGDSQWTLTLHDALGRGKFIKVYAVARDGKLVGGFGATPNFNNATHDTDLSGLVLSGPDVKGDVKIVIQPDPWIPRDHKPISCAFTIEGKAADAEITGTFRGQAGQTEVSGPMDGGLDPKAGPVRFSGGTIKVEDALKGGNEYFSRAFLSMTLEDGKITGGKVWNNHNAKLQGKVEGGTLKFENDMLSGTVQTTVAPGGGVTPGRYEFRVSGPLVGTIGAGTFEGTLDGEKLKSGRYWASFQAAAPSGR